jgi:hypothetical protein
MPGAGVFSSPDARTERLDCGAEKDYKRGKYSSIALNVILRLWEATPLPKRREKEGGARCNRSRSGWRLGFWLR